MSAVFVLFKLGKWSNKELTIVKGKLSRCWYVRTRRGCWPKSGDDMYFLVMTKISIGCLGLRLLVPRPAHSAQVCLAGLQAIMLSFFKTGSTDFIGLVEPSLFDEGKKRSDLQ